VSKAHRDVSPRCAIHSWFDVGVSCFILPLTMQLQTCVTRSVRPALAHIMAWRMAPG
jgi:hypothetical protein